jgi:hypothetical protein
VLSHGVETVSALESTLDHQLRYHGIVVVEALRVCTLEITLNSINNLEKTMLILVFDLTPHNINIFISLYSV